MSASLPCSLVALCLAMNGECSMCCLLVSSRIVRAFVYDSCMGINTPSQDVEYGCEYFGEGMLGPLADDGLENDVLCGSLRGFQGRVASR